MTHPRRISWLVVLVVAPLLLATRAAAQSGTKVYAANYSRSLFTGLAGANVASQYGKLPLSFEANQGQTDSRVKFLSHGNGYTLFLTPSEAVLALQKPAGSPGKRPEGSLAALKTARIEPLAAGTTPEVKQQVLRIKLVRANRAPRVEGLEELPGKSNYFIGNDPKRWRTNVPTYAKVRYHEIYPGVDLVHYGNQRQLESDFVVAPGAKPNSIRLEIVGAERLSIDGQGDLVMSSSAGRCVWKSRWPTRK